MEINSHEHLELTLAKELLNNQQSNTFFSSFSILQAIALLVLNHESLDKSKINHVLGLDWNNYLQKTEEQLQKLSDKSSKHGETPVTLNLANVIYADKTLKIKDEIYQILKQTTKNSKIENIDFKNEPDTSRIIINDFVEQKTKNLIKNLLPNGFVDSDTRSILLNCIYFYGNWKTSFEEHNTKPFPWAGSPNNKNKKFLAMSQKNKNLQILRNHQKFKTLELLRIPYNNNVALYIILNRHEDNIKNPANIFSKIYEMRDEMEDHNGDSINIILPKFNIEKELKPKEIIQKIGFPMTTNSLAHEPLQVDDIIHKAVIKVDEKGTEAAAATAIKMTRCAMIPRKSTPPFIVDRPFVFAIFDDLHEKILFSGYFHEPEFLD